MILNIPRSLVPLALGSALAAAAQSGSIDAAFAANIQSGGGANSAVFCVATDAAGNAFVGGAFTQFAGSPANRIAKVFADGTLDATFTAAVGLVGSDVKAIAVQTDGKILVAGNFSSVGSTPRNHLARLNADGTLDASFAPVLNLPVFALAVQTDGSILAGGQFFFNPGFTRRGVVRLLANGTLDTSFNPGTGANNTVQSLTIDASGRILVTGLFTAFNGSSAGHVVLLEPNGDPVTSFAPVSGADDAIYASAALPGNKYLLGGAFDQFNAAARPALVCVDEDGSVDAGFSATGFASSDLVLSIAVDQNGLPVCGGNFSSYNGEGRSRILRLLTDGTVDQTFTVGSGFSGTQVAGLAIDASGRVLAAGSFNAYQGTPQNGITRIDDCLQTIYYQDADGDGLGDPLAPMSSCSAPTGHVLDNSDCDDTDPGILGRATWYQDNDGDGTGNPAMSVLSCDEQPGYVLDNTDCDDQDPDRYEGAPCDDGDPTTVFDSYSTDCTCIGGAVDVAARVFLDGPFNGTIMNDGLRSAGLIPLSEPYTLLNFHPAEPGGGEQIAAPILSTTGPNAIVDWVMLVLRDDDPPYPRKKIRMALLQRDGDVVDLDGVSPVRFPQLPGPYMLEIRHRNHLGIMTALPMAEVPTGTLLTVDFTSPGTACFGTNARKGLGPLRTMWSGNSTNNGRISYTGSGNDRDPVLSALGGSANIVLTGYSLPDVTMDGLIKYTGSGNDRDPILVNVGSTTPNSVVLEQIP
jgi:uncharacterized delta-60 repeat protein